MHPRDITTGLTQERLRQVLHYEPATGMFTRRLSVNNRTKVGEVVGRVMAGNGYRFIKIDGHGYYAHRLACLYMTGAWPADRVDHINAVRSDNRWGNLRPATMAQNAGNRPMQKNNTSGFKGVFARSGRWMAMIRKGRLFRLGTFDTPEEASAAYEKAASELFGPYARTV